MFEEQQKIKVDNNHNGVIIRQHPDKTSCLVEYNGQTNWVQNKRISKAHVVEPPKPAEPPKQAKPAKPENTEATE